MARRGRGGRERGGGRGQGGAPRIHSGVRQEGASTSFNTNTNNARSSGRQENEPFKSYFSLSEEARNTERHHSWNSDQKLRHSRIAFVSAGVSKPEDLTQLPQEQDCPSHSEEPKLLAENTIEGSARHSKNFATPQVAAPVVPMSNMSLSEGQGETQDTGDLEMMVGKGAAEEESRDEVASQEVFFTDVKGSSPKLPMNLPLPIVRRSLSPTSSESSEEVIVFTGRNVSSTGALKQCKSPKHPRKSQSLVMENIWNPTKGSGKSTATVVEDPVELPAKTGSAETSMPSHLDVMAASIVDIGRPSKFIQGGFGAISGKRGRRRQGRHSRKVNEDAEILEDYISNIRSSGGLESRVEDFTIGRRDLGGSDADQWQDEEELSTEESQMNESMKGTQDWDSADLVDFDDLNTSSEAPDKVERILSKRKRPSGVQYLVVGAGFTTDDARWLPISLLQSRGEGEQIRVFDEVQAELEGIFNSSDTSDGDLTRDQQITLDMQQDLDDLEDERDLEERRKARMTDEQIARLLSKQEELGLGSNDLVLFDGEDDAADELENTQLDGSFNQPFLSRSKRKKRSQPTFPSASAFADVLDQDPYNGFDVMDQDRPSLRKRPKGRRGNLSLELSDSELEQSITMTWENDRTKKKLRRQEREELRAQGLLGKKGKVDMKAKYGEGMSMDQAKSEIRDFLLSSTESLSLPPMAQKERKIVHEIANNFRLKSKSTGSGKSRFPVLYKTARTLQYDEVASDTLNAALQSKRFLPRMDKVKKKGPPTGKARGGFASAGVSYRDGEVVGATAPELGQENRGRAMLEKMGWSTGTVLGALNNTRGIVQPVTQVVKTGKAGLG